MYPKWSINPNSFKYTLMTLIFFKNKYTKLKCYKVSNCSMPTVIVRILLFLYKNEISRGVNLVAEITQWLSLACRRRSWYILQYKKNFEYNQSPSLTILGQILHHPTSVCQENTPSITYQHRHTAPNRQQANFQ